MSAPYVPGDTDMPEWWGPGDEAILRGELAKLADLPRPAGPLPQRTPAVPATPAARPKRSWRSSSPREIGALIIVFAALLLLCVFAFSPDPAPSTTGPGPGACGGQPAACADPPCVGDPASGCGFTTMPMTYGPPGPNGGPQLQEGSR